MRSIHSWCANLVMLAAIFVSSSAWAICDLSDLNPERLLQIAGLPKEQALIELGQLCERVRAEMSRLKTQADLAHTDALTKLPNRHGIHHRFSGRRWHGGDKTFVAMLDIDHFKRVNDTFGHEQGDLVLSQVASQLHNDLRADDFAGRWGGEEFIIIFSADSVVSALRVMTRLRTSIPTIQFNAVDLQGQAQSFVKTISIGLTEFASAEEGLDIARARADAALYKAKERRNSLAFIPAPPGCDLILAGGDVSSPPSPL